MISKKFIQANAKLDEWLALPATQLVLAYLRANCDFIGTRRGNDVNIVVGNEGAIQGWFAAVRAIETCGAPEKEHAPVSFESYGAQMNRAEQPK